MVLKRQEKDNRHKTVICEEDYNKMTENNARNEEELMKIEERLKYLEEKRPEAEILLRKLAETQRNLSEKERGNDEKWQMKFKVLKKQLEEKKDENLRKEETINGMEEELERNLYMNKSSLGFQINRKDRDIQIMKQDIELLSVRIEEQELCLNNKKEELMDKLEGIKEEIEKINSTKEEYLDEKNKEKAFRMVTLDDLNKKFELSGGDREVYELFKGLYEKNRVLNEEKNRKDEVFRVAKDELLTELEVKSNIIKENQKKIEKMNKEYEKLQKSSIDLEKNVHEKLQAGTKKIEAKKQKNKMLRNLFQNMPKEATKILEKNNNLLLKSKKEEKNEIEKELEGLTMHNKELMICMEEMKVMENEKVMEQIEVMNLENDLNEIKRLVKNKQEALKKTKEFNENCKKQLENAL